MAMPFACEILVPQPGIEPMLSVVKGQSPNHWTTRELSKMQVFKEGIISIHGGWETLYYEAEIGTTEDEMVGWLHRLNAHEFG